MGYWQRKFHQKTNIMKRFFRNILNYIVEIITVLMSLVTAYVIFFTGKKVPVRVAIILIMLIAVVYCISAATDRAICLRSNGRYTK